MGFLPENVTPDKPDYALFEELWELTEGPTRNGLSVEDLSYMLMVIRGTRMTEREIDCQAPEEKQGLAKMIIFDQDGNLQFRQGGQAKIAARYKSFYINKLQAEAVSTYPRISKPAEISIEKAIKPKPTLSAKTVQYAEKRKNKMQTEGCDIVEALYRKNTLMQEKKKMRAE